MANHEDKRPWTVGRGANGSLGYVTLGAAGRFYLTILILLARGIGEEECMETWLVTTLLADTKT